MEKDLAERLYRRLKGLSNDLPQDVHGRYRGYLNWEVGKNLMEIITFLQQESTFSHLKKEIENLLSILPHMNPGKINGYMNTDTGSKLFNLIDEILTQIPISLEEKERIDQIARLALISNGVFSVNSPKRKISEFCHSIGETP